MNQTPPIQSLLGHGMGKKVGVAQEMAPLLGGIYQSEEERKYSYENKAGIVITRPDLLLLCGQRHLLCLTLVPGSG